MGQCWSPSKLQEPAHGPGHAWRVKTGSLQQAEQADTVSPLGLSVCAVIVNLGDPGALTLASKDFSVRRSRFPT